MLALILLVVAFSTPVHAAEALRGVALVIGESDYGELPALTNPKNDARAMDDLLGDLGFEVTRVLDADGDKLRGEIADFVAEAKDADVALVYYSGHGIEAGGENYLAPLDASLKTPQTAGATMIPLSSLLDELAKTVPVTIVLLDACRTNAFPPGTLIQPPGATEPVLASDSGLAEVRGPAPIARPDVPATNLGMVIGFAASPGQPALDGAAGEPNSPYAAALLKHLSAGGYSFGDVMTMVSEEVYLKTQAKQLPWVNSSLRRVLNFGAPVEDANPDETAIREGRRSLLLSISGEPPETRAFIESVADKQGVPLDALYGMLKVLGVDTSGSDLEAQLQEGAKRLKALKDQELGTASSDPELLRLSQLAQRAQDEGAIDVALTFREKATERARVLANDRDRLEAGLKADRIEIAAIFAEHAVTAALNFDYAKAGEMYAEAYGQVDKWDDALALDYKWKQANALRDHGDFKGDNASLIASITAFEDALKLAPRETMLATWTSITTDLGWALYTLGSRESDSSRLEQAIEVLTEAANAVTTDTLASDAAITMLNLGNAMSELGQREGDAARLEQSVKVFRVALDSLPRESDPYIWAKIEFNLASTLRLLGERDKGNERLIEAISRFEDSLPAITRQLSPMDWALAQNNYGTALFALGVRQRDVALLDRAAVAFRASLEERKEEIVPLDWGMSQANLANVLIARSDEQLDIPALNEAIAAYRAAMRQLTRERVPLLWATAQSNLAVALMTLSGATGERDLLVQSVEASRASLEVRTRAVDPINWAMTQFNMAGVLQEIGKDEVSDQHLLEAVAAAEAALTEWTRERVPLNWAKAQYQRALALETIGFREDGVETLTKTADGYALALEEFSRAVTPSEWTLTMEHYGWTLQTLNERDEGTANGEKAVEAFQQALLEDTLEADPAEFGRMNFNLALTWQQLDYKGVEGAMDKSIAAYRTALLGYTREALPRDWADTQYRLGYALHTLASREEDWHDHLMAALDAYAASQQVKTRAALPLEWAEVENYIGTALGLWGSKANDVAKLKQGRDALQAAWEIYKTTGDSYDEDFKARIARFDEAIAGMS
ncbi:MAG: caspase family protein [Devosia sp.]